MNGLRSLLAVLLLCMACGVHAAKPGAQKLVGIWYGTHIDSSVAAMPLHWKLWRQADGRFVIDYYVQAGCYLSYSHRERGRWELRRGVYRVLTEHIGERKLISGDKGFQQRFKIAELRADRMVLAQKDIGVNLLLTRIPGDFHMDTMNLCPAEASE